MTCSDSSDINCGSVSDNKNGLMSRVSKTPFMGSTHIWRDLFMCNTVHNSYELCNDFARPDFRIGYQLLKALGGISGVGVKTKWVTNSKVAPYVKCSDLFMFNLVHLGRCTVKMH